MDTRWVSTKWEDLSYNQKYPSSTLERLRLEHQTEVEYTRSRSHKIKIGLGNFKSKAWVYDSELNTFQEGCQKL